MKTPPTPRRRIASVPPFNQITSAAGHVVQDMLDGLRERHPGAKIEIARIDHQPACASHDGRACDCQASPVCILDGREWLRLLPDGTEEAVSQAEPRPEWLDATEGHLLLAEVMPIDEWLRLEFCPVACVIIGDGDSARFLDQPIDAELTRALRRRERHQERQPMIPA